MFNYATLIIFFILSGSYILVINNLHEEIENGVQIIEELKSTIKSQNEYISNFEEEKNVLDRDMENLQEELNSERYHLIDVINESKKLKNCADIEKYLREGLL